LIDNSIYENYENKATLLNSINTINLSRQLIQKIDDKDMTFYSSNASIINFPGKPDIYALNIRFINYTISNKKIVLDHRLTISINKFITLNKNFEIQDDNIFDNNLNTDGDFVGLEDIRLYNQNNQLYYSASYYDKNSKTMKISNNKYIIKDSSLDLIPNIIKVNFETKYTIEKNWAYFDYLNDKYVIYQWSPLKICKIFNDTQLELIETKEVPDIFKSFYGSSGGVSYNDNIWFIVHTKNNYKYYHHFICFDKNMKLIKYSSPFYFQNDTIEFTLSFIIEEDRIIIPYTVEDTKLYIGIYDKNYILNDLNYIIVN
jgi:hypothetical protein